MTQQPGNLTRDEQTHPDTVGWRPWRSAPRTSVFIFLLSVTLLLLLFTILLLRSVPALFVPKVATSSFSSPLQSPGGISLAPLALSGGQDLVYAEQKHIYTVPTIGGTGTELVTPGYIYNRSALPVLTSTGKLLYSGNGIWSMDIASGQTTQLATLAPDQIITSLVLSSDGSMLAWSSAPRNGSGSTRMYAGPVDQTSMIYQQTARQCPCFRAFAFWHDPVSPAGTTKLLVTDDRGDERLSRYGLWIMDLQPAQTGSLHSILSESPQKGPLILDTQTNTLLYTSYNGFVPVPEDKSMPSDINSQSYANSLLLANLQPQSGQLTQPQTLLPEQRELRKSADYHWVATPRFSPDGKTLIYVEFSSDASSPFARHSALYITSVNSSGSHGKVTRPDVLATTTLRYIELGKWLNGQTISFYADGALYALDIQQGEIAKIASIGVYAHIVGTIELG